MKRYLLVVFIITFILCLLNKAGAQGNQTVTNGNNTDAINFPGAGCVYNWVNNTPGIGLSANGTGDIASFKAINTTTSPIIATITATPVSPGYAYVANYNDGTVSVLNLTTNALVTTITVGTNPYGVATSLDGSRVYVTNQGSSTISVINTATNDVAAIIPVSNGSPGGVAVSPDGSKLYVANQNANKVSVFNTATYALLSAIKVGSSPLGVIISPDGGRVYVSNYQGSSVSVINATNNMVLKTIAVKDGPLGLAISADGKRLYVADELSDKISIINTVNNAVLTTIDGGTGPYNLALNKDGSRLFVADYISDRVTIISTADNSIQSVILLNKAPFGVSVSPDGNQVYVTNSGSGDVSVINAVAYSLATSIKTGSGPYSLGNFITTATGCSPVTFTITVNPASAPAATITPGTVSGSIFACQGTNSKSPDIQQFTVSGKNLPGNITVTAPPGFEVSLAAASGYGSSITLVQSGGAVSNKTVYVRSSVSAPPGNISGNVVLTASGVSDVKVVVKGVVNPLPYILPVNYQVVTSGILTKTVNFAGDATSFAWTNDTPGIGLSANGKGDIAPFKAINNSSTPVIATITVIPLSSVTGCNGEPIMFTITVKPAGLPAAGITAGTVSGSISACAGSPSASPDIQQFTVSGGSLTADITATVSNGFEVSLAAGSGYGNSVTLKQSGGTVSNIVVYVRSSATVPADSLSGKITLTSNGTSSREVLVSGTVNALPVINVNTPTQTVVNGQATSPINFTGTGSVINWVNDKPSIGLLASGKGDIPSFAAVNNGVATITAHITAIPVSGGCSGAPVKVTIIVGQSVPVNIIATGALSPSALFTVRHRHQPVLRYRAQASRQVFWLAPRRVSR